MSEPSISDTLESPLSPADLVEIRCRHGKWTEFQREAAYQVDLEEADQWHDAEARVDVDTRAGLEWMSFGGDTAEPDDVAGLSLAIDPMIMIPPEIDLDEDSNAVARRREEQFHMSLELEVDEGSSSAAGEVVFESACVPAAPPTNVIELFVIGGFDSDTEAVDDAETNS